MNYLMCFIIILIVIILLQQHMNNIKPFQNNNNNTNTNNIKNIKNSNDNKNNKLRIEKDNRKVLENFENYMILHPGLLMTEYDGYFSNINWFNNKAPRLSEIVSKIKFFKNSNKEKFSQKYIGIFKPNKTSLYKFKLRSDDASYLYIDGNRIINNGGLHSMREKSGELNVNANQEYKIEIYFGEYTGAEGLEFSYKNTTSSSSCYEFNITNEFYHQVPYLDYKYSQQSILKNSITNNIPDCIPNSTEFKNENLVDKKLFFLQYNYPITISFWANFSELNKTQNFPYNLISFRNYSDTGWFLSVITENQLILDIKNNGTSILNGGISFTYNVKPNTNCFNYYLISFEGFKYIKNNHYYANTTIINDNTISNTIVQRNNFNLDRINYDENLFNNSKPLILENAFFDNITINNNYQDSNLLMQPNTNPGKKKEKQKVIIDYKNDYEKAKPFIDKIHKFGEIEGPLDSGLKNLKNSFQKDFKYDDDKNGFIQNKLIPTMKSHINEEKETLKIQKELGDRQSNTIKELETLADKLNTEINISINEDYDPYQDKTIKSNQYGSIINHLDNKGSNTFLIKDNNNPDKCFYTNSYTRTPNNDKIDCDANDISQKFNIYNINKDSDYIQHLPKINNITDLNKISNHKDFRYPFKIVKSENNNQCLHNYDVNKYKFNECIPHVGQQYRMWNK